MGFFTLSIGLAACGSLLVQYQPELHSFFKPNYLGAFIAIWFLEFWIWAFYTVVLYPKYISPIRNMPGPSGGSWWNGHTSRILREMNGLPVAEWMRTVPHQDMFKYLALFNGERVVPTSPRALAEILSRDYEFVKPSIVAKLGEAILGHGLILSEGDIHKQQRKVVSPSFAVRHIRELIPIFWDKASEATIKITSMIREETATKQSEGLAIFEIGDWASRAALDIISLAALGKDFGAIENPQTELNRTYRTAFRFTRLRTLLGILKTVFPSFLINTLPIPINGEMEVAAKAIRRVCRSVIYSQKEKLEKDELNSNDIVSLVLKNGDLKNEKDIIDQMTTMLAAGHDTVSVGVTWAVYMMCVHPKWQTIIRKEVRASLPSPNLEQKIEASKIEMANMPFLNVFVSEVLRYWPPVSMTTRVAAVDTEVLGWKINKGTRFTLSMIATNRDETLWGKDARIFRPERWMSEKEGTNGDALGGASSKYAMLTFLHGHRSCIGSGFARSEIACLIAALVGRFEFSLKNESELEEKNLKITADGFAAKPSGGVWLKARVVDGW